MNTSDNLTTGSVVFFDLWGTLVQRGSMQLIPSARQLLRDFAGLRCGILCNLPVGQTARDVQLLLESLGLGDRFVRELIVIASVLPVRLPDPRAFAVAAALAESPLEQCVFVSSDQGWRQAAVAARMRAVAPPAPTPPVGLTARVVSASGTATTLELPVAAEVDPDAGATFVLKGRLVTMCVPPASAVIDRGWIVVQRGKIAALGRDGEPVPPEFGDAVTLETRGTIYPGLMDLHNHLAYNVLPLWSVPRKYSNRGQWPRDPSYAPNVQMPINILGSYEPTARAIVRYIEIKALLGGTTTAQGVRSKQGGMTKLYRGSMRNVEQTDDPRLPEAGSRVLNYKPGDADDTGSFRAALGRHKAYFYHLSEGTDREALSHFTDLKNNDLVQPALVGIHSLGLQPADLCAVAEKGAKVVWSPFSNLLLYGQTLDLKALKESGAQFSIGCDWSPTGSKNLLEELKVARFVSALQGSPFSSRDLVHAVTTSAAEILGWNQYVGALRPGMFADLVVISGLAGDPYDRLIDATEKDVLLVTVHGTPRVAEPKLMARIHADSAHPTEQIRIDGVRKALNHYAELSPLNGLSLAEATRTLKDAMSDLPAFLEKTRQAAEKGAGLRLAADEGFTLELDNEFDEEANTPAASLATTAGGLMAGPLFARTPAHEVATSVTLDPLTVKSGSHLATVAGEKNLPPALGKVLEEAYA